MKKITNIKITKITTRITINELGEKVQVKVPYELTHKVKTIQGWPRFGHYLLDAIIIFVILLGVALFEPTRSLFEPIFTLRLGSFLYEFNIIGYLAVLIYYTLTEATMGRTLGKFATNSFVINEYGQLPDITAIIKRSFARLIPFNAFSCLGERGWHDQISRTYVVSKTEWEALKRGLGEDNGYSDDTDILDA